MPIPVTCSCGRTMQVKDEMAGSEGVCPMCGKTISIPEAAKKKPSHEPRTYGLADGSVADSRPSGWDDERGRRTDSDRMKTPRDRDRVPSTSVEDGWITSPKAGVVGGVALMAIGVVWFFLGFLGGQIFSFPLVLFVMGVIGLMRGLKGRQ